MRVDSAVVSDKGLKLAPGTTSTWARRLRTRSRTESTGIVRSTSSMPMPAVGSSSSITFGSSASTSAISNARFWP